MFIAIITEASWYILPWTSLLQVSSKPIYIRNVSIPYSHLLALLVVICWMAYQNSVHIYCFSLRDTLYPLCYHVSTFIHPGSNRLLTQLSSSLLKLYLDKLIQVPSHLLCCVKLCLVPLSRFLKWRCESTRSMGAVYEAEMSLLPRLWWPSKGTWTWGNLTTLGKHSLLLYTQGLNPV